VALVPILSLPAVADALFGAAQRSARSGDSASALAVLERASGLVPWVEELPRAAGLLWWQRAAADGNGEATSHAEANLLEAARRAPHDPFPQLRLLQFYLMSDDWNRAEAACQRAIEIGALRAMVWSRCADVSAGRGLADEARHRRERAERLR
jgi:tetratricopeptide (TPR) repeat protein